MKRVIAYILCCIFACSVFGQTVQIDSISGSQIRVPVFTNGDYSYSQQIIGKNKIIENGWSENAGSITRIRYHFNEMEGLINSNDWKIYIGETDKNFFATTTDWETVENMTLVYDGLIAEPLSTGWYDIILQSPFPYDGARNLIIAIDENSPNYTPSHTYYSSFNDTVNSGLFFYSQGPGEINPDPVSPPAGNLTTSIPVLQFYFDEICSSPASFILSTLNATSADFTWIPQGTESSWNLRYKPTNKSIWTTISEIANAEYSLTNLFSIESYIVQIQSVCVDTVSEWINPIYFTTPEIPGLEYTVDWEIFKYKTEGDFSIMIDSLPDLVIKLDSVVTPDYSTSMDGFFSRIRGYIIPRTSGEFSFHFGSNDIGEFWLSSDESEANSVLAISNDTIQTDLTLNHYLQNLIEGNKYYFEILHYDSVYTDLIKLGWTFPGDTIIRTLKAPFISSCGTNVLSQNLSFLNSEITGYPESQHSIICRFSPWYASDKRINWLSTDVNIATVDESGIVTLVSEGSCRIIGRMADNENATDTLNINVWNYPGPFFVKPGASKESNGKSWESAIDLQTLLKVLNTRIDNQIITVNASAGIYKPTEILDRNITFSIQSIRLVGGFSASSSGTDTTTRNLENHETILSGDIGVQGNTLDNSYHVVTAFRSAIIDGFTIRDGRASCSSYSFALGGPTIVRDNNGGGVYIPRTRSDVILRNCNISGNSAWNGGAGIFCDRASININQSSLLSLLDCSVHDNQIQQTYYNGGGIFNIQVNGHGGGIFMNTSTLKVDNSLFFRNNTAYGYGRAIYLDGSRATINKSSIYQNIGEYEDLWASGSTFNLNNTTLVGSLVTFFLSNSNVYNSTIIGGGYIHGPNSHVILDNSIWTEVDLDQYSDTTMIAVKYSILGNSLFGNNKYDVISDTLPSYLIWLDSLANNGGTTPTMKLKNITGNYALNYGNPLYLDSTDQRGAIRTNFVSIGAYQWVDATEIIISPHQLTLTQGDSIDFEVYFLPAFSSNGLYTVSCSDNNIARVDSSKIYALLPGFVNIIAQSSDGMLRDTLLCQVIANAGIEEAIPNNKFIVYPNPATSNIQINTQSIDIVDAMLTISDLSGRQLLQTRINRPSTIIDVHAFPQGIYLVKLADDRKVLTGKFVKQ